MGGRKSKFNDTLKEEMLKMYAEGKTDREVARAIGVSVRTIENWKVRYPSFFQSLKDAKAKSDEVVEGSLLRRAIGYDAPEEKVFCQNGKPISVETIKHYPPDVLAIIYWLKNRNPDKWK